MFAMFWRSFLSSGLPPWYHHFVFLLILSPICMVPHLFVSILFDEVLNACHYSFTFLVCCWNLLYSSVMYPWFQPWYYDFQSFFYWSWLLQMLFRSICCNHCWCKDHRLVMHKNNLMIWSAYPEQEKARYDISFKIKSTKTGTMREINQISEWIISIKTTVGNKTTRDVRTYAPCNDTYWER